MAMEDWLLHLHFVICLCVIALGFIFSSVHNEQYCDFCAMVEALSSSK